MKERRHRGAFITAIQTTVKNEFGPAFQIQPSIGLSQFVGGPYQDRSFLDLTLDIHRRTKTWHWNLRMIWP